MTESIHFQSAYFDIESTLQRVEYASMNSAEYATKKFCWPEEWSVVFILELQDCKELPRTKAC